MNYLTISQMNNEKIYAGFIVAGGIARAHAFALNSLRYYYNDSPKAEFEAVCSSTENSRNTFAGQFGFRNPVSLEGFLSNKIIDTVYILGPNKVHFDHLTKVLTMPAIKRIYIEKPVCSNIDEEMLIAKIVRQHPEIKIQTGFQYLFMSSVSEALNLWKTGKLGKPIHFDLKYYHGDYLQKEYRDKRSISLNGGSINS